MKKNIGAQLALYPTPLTIIGAINGPKPTWTLVAHVGIMGHSHILVSLAASHFINGCIKNTHKLSISIVNEQMLPQADYSGAVSGAKESKADLFSWQLGEAGTPIIEKSPLTMECTVADTYSTPGFENFICTIDHTYVEEKHLNEAGKINYHSLKPVLFEFPTYEYLKTGDVIGKCLSFQNKE